jgi:L-threonylcarbamoyladenylate synthase
VEAREGEALLFYDGASRDEFLRNRGAVDGAGPLVRALSEDGSALEAAANLFDLLHFLDAAGVTVIRAERADGGGLGAAINDRLYKASRKD